MSQNGSFPHFTYQQQLQQIQLLQHQHQQVLLQQQQHLQHRRLQQQQQQQHQEQKQQQQQQPRVSDIIGNGVVVVGAQNTPAMPSLMPASARLRPSPNRDHTPENYEGLQLGFDPRVYSSLEQYMPAEMLDKSRNFKADYMTSILGRYSSQSDRIRTQRNREYRQKILSAYAPLNKEIYTMNAENFFVPSFLNAIRENTEAGFKRILAEPARGVYTFEMLQPEYCDMLASEVDHFERWVHNTKFKIMRPSTLNKFGVVLDDLGMGNMLEKLMNEFIRPLARVLFSEIGGCSLDSHHGYVVEYGIHRDQELGFHVDDAEVTLNLCLGKEFTGGELFFRGVRCEAHVNTEAQLEEIFDYAHVPGQAVLHCGRHRHGARPIASGKRMNLILWCRSSKFREMIKYQREFAGWCAECKRKKKERERIAIAATKQEILKRGRIQ